MKKITESDLRNIIKESVHNILNETKANKFSLIEVYDGRSGGAYNGGRYLSKAISSKGKKNIAESLNEGIQFEPNENERGGIIVFSTDVNAETLSSNRFINFLKQKLVTISNRINATKKIDKIAKENELVGWTIGHYLDGRYTAKNGKEYGENSLSVEIIGVTFDTLYKIAMELCESFKQESVLLKDFSSGRVAFVDRT